MILGTHIQERTGNEETESKELYHMAWNFIIEENLVDNAVAKKNDYDYDPHFYDPDRRPKLQIVIASADTDEEFKASKRLQYIPPPPLPPLPPLKHKYFFVKKSRLKNRGAGIRRL